MRITVLKIIRPILIAEALVLSSYFYSSLAFTNIQVAFMSSLFIILGSSIAYRGMVQNQVQAESYEDKRDLFDEIEDPHEL
jgi:predicted phage tail protein